MRTRVALCTTVLLALGTCGQALAADDVTVTVGLRAWVNEWSSWDVLPAGGGIPSAVENYTSGSKTAWLPALSVRYKDFSFSGSMMTNTKYSFNGVSGSFTGERKEYDLAVGYFLLPSVSVNLGYKSVEQRFGGAGGNSDFTYKGPFIGLSASAPLGNQWALYGNVAVGRLDADFPSAYATPALLGSSSSKADYRLGEIGVAYLFGPAFSWSKNVALTIGYRAQVLDTDLTLPRGGATATGFTSRSTNGRDNTEGLSIGLSVSF